MAENYTPEEIQRITDEFGRALNEAGGDISKVSSSLVKEFTDAQTAVKNYTYNLKQSLDRLGSSITGIGKKLTDGETGASVFNDSISAGADALSNYASKFGPAGKALGIFAKGLSMYVGAVNKQADSLYKGFQEMSRAGAIGAGGIKDVYTDLKAFGYGIKELNEMQALLRENSKTLAKFGGTAMDGTRIFAQLANTLQHSAITEHLMNMGLSVDEINKGAAGYIKQQTMLGRNAADQGKNLASNTAAYIEQLESITRLTGLQRSEIEERQADAMREGAFARKRAVEQAALDEAQRKGDVEAEAKHKAELQKLDIINYGLEGETRKQAMAAVMGDISRSTKLFLSAGPEAFDAITNPAKTGGDMLNALNQGFKRTQDTLGDMAGYGDTFNKNLIPLNEQMALNAQYNNKDANQIIADIELRKKSNDATTNNMVKLGIEQRKARDNMEDFVNLGIKPVTSAMEWLAKVVEGLTSLIPGAGKYKKQLEEEKRLQTAAYKDLIKEPSADKTSTQESILAKLSSSGITDKRAQANILAQIKSESGGVASKEENLNYTPEQLMKTFPKKFKNIEEAREVAAQGPEAIGNKIYGGRADLGNAADEGFKYRGRGLIQLTGKSNYEKYGKLLGIDLVKNPELAAQPDIAEAIAVAYFKEAQAKGANLSDITEVNKAVGFVGVNDYSSFGEAGKRWKMAQEIEKQLPTTASNQPTPTNIPQAAMGDILSGPKSGFQALLHGTEAVVPLPDGRTIPVEMRGFGDSMGQQNSLLAQQISKLDELINIMNNQVSVSNKILKQTG